MKRSRARLLLVAVVVVAGGLLATTLANRGSAPPASSDPHADPHLSRAETARILNATSAADASTPAAELVADGRALFRDPSVARNGESCQSCHTEATANTKPDAEGAVSGLGTTPHTQTGSGKPTSGDFTGPRDAPNLVNAGRTAPYFWTGSRATLREAVIDTIKTHFKDGASQDDATTARQAAALVAYIEQLRAPRTAFDEGTMSAAAERGLRLFQTKGGCIACHGGPDFTDNRLHATCVPQAGAGDNDPGATVPGMFDCTKAPMGQAGLGAFNTPQLRDLAATAPYMHNGAFTTLEQVVEFYNEHSSIAPLGLTQDEIDDLVAFLKSL